MTDFNIIFFVLQAAAQVAATIMVVSHSDIHKINLVQKTEVKKKDPIVAVRERHTYNWSDILLGSHTHTHTLRGQLLYAKIEREMG